MRFSSPRIEWGFRYDSEERSRAPNWSSQAEFTDWFTFVACYRAIAGFALDVMLEARAKDVAVMQLCRDLAVARLAWRLCSA